jgi:hypothetical protein
MDEKEGRRMPPHDSLLARIRQSAATADLLTELCDFELTDSRDNPPWFALKSPGRLEVIARDKSGALFALCSRADLDGQPVLYVSSEDGAGVLGGSLAEALALMVSLPGWRDYLKFSGGAKLEEMKKAAPHIERDLREDHPGVEREKKELLLSLGLDPLPSPIETLHRIVSENSIGSVLMKEDGSKYDTLFNTFTAKDNPMWSDR